MCCTWYIVLGVLRLGVLRIGVLIQQVLLLGVLPDLRSLRIAILDVLPKCAFSWAYYVRCAFLGRLRQA